MARGRLSRQVPLTRIVVVRDRLVIVTAGHAVSITIKELFSGTARANLLVTARICEWRDDWLVRAGR
jgi:hypothetical protein